MGAVAVAVVAVYIAAAAAATAAAVVNILKTPHEANLGLENFEFAYFS